MHWTEIARRTVGGVAVLDLRGEMTLSGDEDLRLLHQIQRVLDDGFIHIIVNLASVAYLDSTGVGEIVGAYTRVLRSGGMLKLCCVSARTEELLRAANIDSVVHWFATESAAVESF
jgi:anti-sigma B factor antagonist